MPRSAIVLLTACALLTACGPTDPFPRGKLRVVAAENAWGSLAAQLGGDRASVRSIVVDPGADPHAYEPTASDAVTMASAQVAIVNGIGYDAWASRLLAVDAPRATIDVGATLGLSPGDNPHQWYSPASVAVIIDAITHAYTRVDPRDAAYFETRRSALLTNGLARYDALLRAIRSCCAGVPVGYSESVFAPLGRALGLRLATPAGFARAVAEGVDVSAADKAAVDRAISRRAIAVWVYNSQDVTPDVQRANALARAAHIPIVAITETLAPARASFQRWQARQLTALLRALR